MDFLANKVGADSCVTWAMDITMFLNDYFDPYNIIHFTTKIIQSTYIFVEVVCSKSLKCGNKRQHQEQNHPFSIEHGNAQCATVCFPSDHPAPTGPTERPGAMLSTRQAGSIRYLYCTHRVPAPVKPKKIMFRHG